MARGGVAVSVIAVSFDADADHRRAGDDPAAPWLCLLADAPGFNVGEFSEGEHVASADVEPGREVVVFADAARGVVVGDALAAGPLAVVDDGAAAAGEVRAGHRYSVWMV